MLCCHRISPLYTSQGRWIRRSHPQTTLDLVINIGRPDLIKRGAAFELAILAAFILASFGRGDGRDREADRDEETVVVMGEVGPAGQLANLALGNKGQNPRFADFFAAVNASVEFRGEDQVKVIVPASCLDILDTSHEDRVKVRKGRRNNCVMITPLAEPFDLPLPLM